MSKKIMKKAIALTLAMSMAFSTAVVSNAAKKKANTTTVATTGQAVPGTVLLKKGKKVVLTTKASKCTVKVANKNVASAKVSKKKVTITAKKAGTTKVTISKKGYKNKVVTVKVGTPAVLKLASTKATVKVGATKTVKVSKFTSSKVGKKSTKATVKAASSNKKVATVKATNKKVTIKGVKAGKATIKVYASDASVCKSIKVTVAKASTPAPTPAVETVKTTIKADKGVFTLPCSYEKVTALTVKKGTKSYTLAGDFVTKSIAEFKNKTAKTNFAAKKAGDELATVNNIKATVKADAANGAKIVTFAGKDYTVTVTDTAVTVGNTTFTPDATKNTLTVTNSKNVDKTAGVEIEVTYTK